MILKGRIALMPGPDHYDHFKNRQDMARVTFVRDKSRQVVALSAVIIDGCTESETAETSGLIGDAASAQLAFLVNGRPSDQIDHEGLGSQLYSYVTDFMYTLISKLPYGTQYLSGLQTERLTGVPFVFEKDSPLAEVFAWTERNLMCTFLFAYSDQYGTFTACRGDGGFQIDDLEPRFPNYNNIPPYVANIFIPRSILLAARKKILIEKGITVNHPPPGFETNFVPGARRFSMFSDWMDLTLLKDAWGADLLDNINLWGVEGSRNMLQKQLRAWWKQGLVHDDASLVMFEWTDQE